jgi:hypothetical protein
MFCRYGYKFLEVKIKAVKLGFFESRMLRRIFGSKG